jgi:choline/glycine/proline betaine transport protein/glycine betaine transporter
MNNDQRDERSFDPLTFWVSASLTVPFILWSIAQNPPLTGLLATVLRFLSATFFRTGADSAALALAMFVSGRETPGRTWRACWGVALGAVAAVRAGTGSLRVMQTASIATAFPLIFLLLVVIYGTFKGLRAYRAAHDFDESPSDT